MRALRAPDERFADLPGFALVPRYVEDLRDFEGLRMHYLDAGPHEGAPPFCACTGSRPGAICTVG